jgi:hypothetical protein
MADLGKKGSASNRHLRTLVVQSSTHYESTTAGAEKAGSLICTGDKDRYAQRMLSRVSNLCHGLSQGWTKSSKLPH